MRLTQRVFLGSLLVIGVMTTLVVSLADRRLDRRLVAVAVDGLRREANVITTQWRAGADADSLADAVGRALERRVTLIDASGRVVGDS